MKYRFANRPVFVLPFLIAAFAALAIACGSDGPGAEPTSTAAGTPTPTPAVNPPTPTPSVSQQQQELDDARKRWQSHGINSYVFVQRWSGFFVSEPVRITVRNGSISEIVNLQTGQQEVADGRTRAMTVEQLFDWIEEGIQDEDKLLLAASYSDEFGFPAEVVSDRLVGATDTTLSVQITDFSEDPDDARLKLMSELEIARNKWLAGEVSNYSFDLTRSCFCSYEGRPVHVTVVDGEVTEMTDPISGERLSEFDSGPPITIDKLFLEIERAIAEPRSTVEVEYERDLGWPFSAFIDWDSDLADDGISYRISNLRQDHKAIDIERLRRELADARERWALELKWGLGGVESYEFDFKWVCFCPPPAGKWVHVVVEDGQITSTTDAETGEPIEALGGLEYMTLPEMFDWIGEQLDRSPDHAKLEYGVVYGAPTEAWFDPIKLAVDEEIAFVTRNFQPYVVYDDLQAELDSARDLWEELGWQDYTFQFNWQCFCIEDYVARVNIFVRNGEVVAVLRAGNGQPVSENLQDEFATVDALFDRLQSAIDESAASISAEFNAENGLPVSVFIDYDRRIADEEMGWLASDVEEWDGSSGIGQS